MSSKEAAPTSGQKKQTSAQKFAEVMAHRVIEMIEQGGLPPWKRTWRFAAMQDVPYNPVTNHRYSGGNSFFLSMALAMSGSDDPRFMTFKQAKELGEDTAVAKGATGTGIWLLRPLVIRKKDDDDALADARKKGAQVDDDDDDERTFVIYKPFKVHHVSAVENAPPLGRDDAPEADPEDSVLLAREFVEACGLTVTHGGDEACYLPALDVIRMPKLEQYERPGEYVHTLLHEAFHATGVKHRSARCDYDGNHGKRYSKEYAMEELRAELFGLVAAARFGAEPELENNAAYLAGWKERLRDQEGCSAITAALKGTFDFLEEVDRYIADDVPKADWMPTRPSRLRTVAEAGGQVDGEIIAEIAAVTNSDDASESVPSSESEAPQPPPSFSLVI